MSLLVSTAAFAQGVAHRTLINTRILGTMCSHKSNTGTVQFTDGLQEVMLSTVDAKVCSEAGWLSFLNGKVTIRVSRINGQDVITKVQAESAENN